jgi:formate-dependent nitrite reductase membrane component NrfD
VVANWGFRIAFPLIILCALFLTVDLNRPERFWHMLFRSETVGAALDAGWPWSGRGWSLMADAPLLKYWSPMSIGSWALTLFGVCSFLALVGTLWPDGRLAAWLHHGVLARVIQLVGCLVGFFVASYTGALITATNQPLWSDNNWIAPLFLTSAASTGIGTLMLLILLGPGATDSTLQRLLHADSWSIGLEAAALVMFVLALWPWILPVWGTTQGKLLLAAVPVMSVIVPLVIHLSRSTLGSWSVSAAAVVALVGGFLLRYSIVNSAPELLARGAQPVAAAVSAETTELLPRFSPEDRRPPGGGAGADPGNYVGEVQHVQPRTKLSRE